MKIQEQVPLAPLTTLRVGGPARYFAEAKSCDEAREAVEFASSRRLPLFVLGGGSNLVVADSGFSGMVLKVGIRGIECRKETGRLVFEVGAGEDWDDFVKVAVSRGCAGIECLSGIPGKVGGTPVQNVGAYGQEVAETIFSVRVIEMGTGEECDFSNAECGFAYRTSRFNTVDRGRYIITRVAFSLVADGQPKLTYGDLKKRFGENASPTVAQVRDAVLSIRRSKGMVLDEYDSDSCSAGSFFKNPVLTNDQFRDLEQRSSARGLTIPSYQALASQHKVSAAWLIEQAGFPKGLTRGPVGISAKHTLAIVNRGGAKAADVVALMQEIQKAVTDQFGIELQPEPVFLGF